MWNMIDFTYAIIPPLISNATAFVMFPQDNFQIMRLRWFWTVLCDMPRSSAVPLMLAPPAAAFTISISLGLSFFQVSWSNWILLILDGIVLIV